MKENIYGFKFEKALKILASSYSGKTMKKPSLFHSLRVGVFLWNNNYDEDLQIAGVLHDSLEDTDITEKIILDNFGKEVLDIVKANSKNSELDKETMKIDIVKRCVEIGERAMIVKLADVYDNFLFYKKNNNINEIERCKIFAELIKKYKKEKWNDRIFKKLEEILDF